ncbi:MAG: hypothetical protein ACJASK_000952 [Ilumatobacter sp.]|jgi:hypothetical protein
MRRQQLVNRVPEVPLEGTPVAGVVRPLHLREHGAHALG